jgi:hypothetical protein
MRPLRSNVLPYLVVGSLMAIIVGRIIAFLQIRLRLLIKK